MRALRTDLRYALRLLGKNPTFTAIVVVTLALGIGANSAVFSVVNAVMLRSLPYRDQDRLVVVWEQNLNRGLPQMFAAPPNFADWRAQNRVFREMSVFRARDYSLSGRGEPERLSGAGVSGNIFSLLGVAPALGRGFTDAEDRPGAPATVVLSHGLWQRRFGGSSAAIGQSLTLNGEPHAIIGVMPPGFDFPPPISFKGDPAPIKAELWTPFRLALESGQRGAHNLFAIARLKDGVTEAEAQADLEAIAARLGREYPPTNAGWGVTIVPFTRQITGRFQSALLLLLGAVGLVLLIACANVANLLLARGVARGREYAIRAALGADRRRLIGQSLSESLLLALAGGALGLLLAAGIIKLIIVFGPQNIYRLEAVEIDLSVVGFTLLASLLTSIICGLLPALQTSQVSLTHALKEGGSGGEGAGRRRWRNVLVIAEMALSVLLLVAAGLLLRSLSNLQNQPLGFQTENLVAMTINLPSSNYPQGRDRVRFFEDLERRISALPGVQSVAYSDSLPLGADRQGTSFEVEGRPAPPQGQENQTNFSYISPDYFRALGIALQRGRSFSANDRADAAPVVIVNRTLAERFFPGEEPVGKRLRIGVRSQTIFEIVGVATDERHESLQAVLRPGVYLPFAQLPVGLPMKFFIRGTSEMGMIVPAARREAQAIDQRLPVYDVKTMREVLSNAAAQPRFVTFLLLGFAGVALLLSAVGIYGVMAYLVTQHTREIGLRVALGAQPRDVLRLIIGQGLTLSIIGAGLGLGGAFTLARLLTNQLYGVTAHDPLTFVGVATLLISVSAIASYLPARRAMKIDPMIALRYE